MRIPPFLSKQFSVARVYGIPVRIDFRWFFVFAACLWLVAYHLQLGTLRLAPLGAPAAWLLAAVTTVALFLSVFGHELSHAIMGRAEGIETEEILLHPFGGLARLRYQPDSPRAEFRIAIAGPAASFIFAVFAYLAMWIATLGGYWHAAEVFFFVASGNLLLAIFNLIPGYPLDGGRILRSLLWRRGGNIHDATRIAGICGQVFALALIISGGYILFAWPRNRLMGAWSVLVGLFLLDAATSVVRYAAHSRTVAEVMAPPVAVDPNMLVSQFVDSVLPLHRQTAFPVASAGKPAGILALQDLKKVPRERWRGLRIADVMRAAGPGFCLEMTSSIEHARQIMRENEIGAVAVVDSSGTLVGFLTRQLDTKP